MNRLSAENSPYLLQHQTNPVDWYPWGAEALEAAQTANKPILLSIGYSACHWCHVMERETFEDEGVAGYMNEHFINIKVDREERPDLDSIYMAAVVGLTGQGGWPLSVFLTPAGLPFYGGTYFPPTRQHNLPSFREVLEAVSTAWTSDQENVLKSAATITESIGTSLEIANPTDQNTLDATLHDRATLRLAQSYDWTYGGWGQAPKFPQPMAINVLFLRAASGDKLALEMAQHCLIKMARGGMYDIVGGGFARYSVDRDWLIPHFEKMLYDNAQLALAYLRGYLLTRSESLLKTTRETLNFLIRELQDSGGGFYSSLDADSEGEEGKYYTWTTEELAGLGSGEDFPIVVKAFGLDSTPNFDGRWILRPDSEGTASGQEQTVVAEFLQRLFVSRQSRIRPATDDKILLAWNALTIVAMADAARSLEDANYSDAAIRCGEFIINNMRHKHGFFRSWRRGKGNQLAYLEDLAALGLAFLSLYQSSHDLRWFQESSDILDRILTDFATDTPWFDDIGRHHESLIIKPRDLQDNAFPSGNSLAALLLLRMSVLTGNMAWRDRAVKMITGIGSLIEQHPTAFANWLYAYHYALQEKAEVAILFDPKTNDAVEFAHVLGDRWLPWVELAVSEFPPHQAAPPLVQERPLIEGKPTIYVCQNFSCKAPFTERERLHAVLKEIESAST